MSSDVNSLQRFDVFKDLFIRLGIRVDGFDRDLGVEDLSTLLSFERRTWVKTELWIGQKFRFCLAAWTCLLASCFLWWDLLYFFSSSCA